MRFFFLLLMSGLFASSAHALDLQIDGSFSCNGDWEITGTGAAVCRDVAFSGYVSNGVNENMLNARIFYSPAVANAMCASAGYTQAVDAEAGMWDGGFPREIGENWIITLNEKLEVLESKWRPSNGMPYFLSLTCE